MSNILGADIAVNDDGDFIIDVSAGDFAGVDGLDCVLSDLKFLAGVSPGSLIDAPYSGALFSRDIPATDFEILKVQRTYEDFLRQDPRVKEDSIKVEVSVKAGVPAFSVSFKTIDEQVVKNLIL
jgi:hypothetical protein